MNVLSLLTLALLLPTTDDLDRGPGFVLFGSEGAPPQTQNRRIDPVSAPLTFESPWIDSNIKPTILWHSFPNSSIFGGGDVRIYAVQARLALTENLAFIATKDGYIDFNPDEGEDETGFADIAGGFKWAITLDESTGLTITPGLTLELAQGDREVLQGGGEGIWRPFVSAGCFVGDIQLMGNVGFSIPIDGDAESQSVDYHFHASCEVVDGFFPLVEINGITYTDGGRALPVDFEALDYSSIGADDVEGNDIITGALGARLRLTDGIHLGLAYETPLTSREDIFDDRWTFDLVWRF